MKLPSLPTLLLIVILLLGVSNVLQRAKAAKSEAALLALASEKAAADLRLAGYATTFAHVSNTLVRTDSVMKAMAAAASLRAAKVVTLIETRVDTLIASQQSDSGHYEAQIEIEPLSGSVAFFPLTADFGLNLVCSPRIEQYIVQTADDQLLIGVRPLSPRTVVRTEAFDATPYLRRPSPQGVRWYHLPIVGGLGLLGGMLLK